MCIIAIKPSHKKLFSEEIIRTMFENNPDGAGLMYAEKGELNIVKGFMSLESLLTYLNSRDWTSVPLILHFRIGTSGTKSRENCHPYPVGERNFLNGKCKLGMAHNGILYEYEPPANSDLNDTRMFLHEVIEKLPEGWLENEGICTLVQHEIFDDRLAFMDNNGKIKTFGEYICEDGYMFSNDSFQKYTFSYPLCSTTKEFKDDETISFRNEFYIDNRGQYVCPCKSQEEFEERIAELSEKCSEVAKYTKKATGETWVSFYSVYEKQGYEACYGNRTFYQY